VDAELDVLRTSVVSVDHLYNGIACPCNVSSRQAVPHPPTYPQQPSTRLCSRPSTAARVEAPLHAARQQPLLSCWARFMEASAPPSTSCCQEVVLCSCGREVKHDLHHGQGFGSCTMTSPGRERTLVCRTCSMQAPTQPAAYARCCLPCRRGRREWPNSQHAQRNLTACCWYCCRRRPLHRSGSASQQHSDRGPLLTTHVSATRNAQLLYPLAPLEARGLARTPAPCRACGRWRRRRSTPRSTCARPVHATGETCVSALPLTR
jgi:hypothetical protein